MTTILLLGATGLVGAQTLRLALSDPRVAKVVAPSRRPLPPHPKLENPVVDFDALPEDAPWWKADAAVCALGTTMRRAGSPEAFRKVDHDYPLTAARLAKRGGTRAYALVSSTGADPKSRIFYSRVKGETEQALRAVGFPSLTILRPSLLGGEREEFRPAERLATLLFKTLSPLIPPRKRMVPAERVAKALLEAALSGENGAKVIESENI
jgi:uncharacterized protein YbjT (DUF2867 family)